jgi:hypothetical protein
VFAPVQDTVAMREYLISVPMENLRCGHLSPFHCLSLPRVAGLDQETSRVSPFADRIGTRDYPR